MCVACAVAGIVLPDRSARSWQKQFAFQVSNARQLHFLLCFCLFRLAVATTNDLFKSIQGGYVQWVPAMQNSCSTDKLTSKHKEEHQQSTTTT